MNQYENTKIDDLYTAVVDRLDELQKPVDVHFTPGGSEFLAQTIADFILAHFNMR